MNEGVLGKLCGWLGDGDRNRFKIFLELDCFVIVRDELRTDDELDTVEAFDLVDLIELVDRIELGCSSLIGL